MFEKQAIVEWVLVKGHRGKGADLVQEDADYVARRIKETGFNSIVWDAGRSIVTYHSKLENVTLLWDRRDDQTDPHTVLLRKRCQLRYGIEQAKPLGLSFAARLCMNRHYAGGPGTSHFSEENPQFHCVNKEGKIDSGRLSYFFDEVKKERIDILNELAEIEGVDCIHLDFCRQPPHLAYHPKLVEAFIKEYGYDPREIKTPYYTDCLEWYQYRADIMTEFMRQLRAKVGSKANIEARIPDCAPWLNLYCGIDAEAWCREDLADKLTLSPLLSWASDPMPYTEYYATIAHAHGKKCIGGIGSLCLMNPVQRGYGREIYREALEKNYEEGLITERKYKEVKALFAMSDEERFKKLYDREGIFALAYKQYMAGIDGMSLYQAETVVEEDWFAEDLQLLLDPEKTKAEYAKMGYPSTVRLYQTGTDWHSTVFMGNVGYDI